MFSYAHQKYHDMVTECYAKPKRTNTSKLHFTIRSVAKIVVLFILNSSKTLLHSLLYWLIMPINDVTLV